ncbi:2OG-Fe(II) oxygenase superfamily protein [Heliocybe sulcata]|uniref:2OG-Fe(II) oxygenase superfamily protein n=1 Tax=Heliocybe sulcata TaxID=5364 RepID=A0A5C3N0W5_9AGAM|nr:2OG-Fe(II) oxygenase superfamily protein [Heliocybe sulcata]
MSTITITEQPSTHQLKLRTAYGPVYRTVLDTPPRDCDEKDIPIIDISGIYGDLDARKAVAQQIQAASTSIGFFYVKGHGISDDVIADALAQSRLFFSQPTEIKDKVNQKHSKWFNGWNSRNSSHVSETESMDYRESFGMRYEPRYDPAVDNTDSIPPEIQAGFRAEEYVWEQTANLPDFKSGILNYWRACLSLARRLIRIFALALDLPEDYFDKMTSHPDAAVALNYYPSQRELPKIDENTVSIGSHTDLQCFTMLWQDDNGGLQVLNRDGQWINAKPIPGTFVINIGDYLMRITNDRFVSTVHRAKNVTPNERYSMPFFFGFNFNETVGVLPSCIDEERPAKYDPISCEEWVRLRFAQTTQDRE